MRKYQQLICCIISIVSLIILIMYKNENYRLKSVLQVVNFFGRRDDQIRLEKITRFSSNSAVYDFSNPLPVWTRISKDFHVYSSYWSKNELVPGSETQSIVVGLADAIVNFKCSVRFNGAKTINGKFAFLRMYDHTSSDRMKNATEEFVVFKFLCKFSRDFGEPRSLILKETKSTVAHELQLRFIKSKLVKEKILLTACVNFVPYKTQKSDESLFPAVNKSQIMQFFIHHQAIGVNEFLVYNSDAVPSSIKELLYRAGIRINYFPYNFPFNFHAETTRKIIEMDCVMRNTNAAEFCLVLDGPIEFLYPQTNIQFKGSPLRNLRNHNPELNHFELPNFSVCINESSKLLIDNNRYDPEYNSGHKVVIYKPTIRDIAVKNMQLYASNIFVHTYVNCGNKDDSALLNWRSSVREDFIQYIETVRTEISFLF